MTSVSICDRSTTEHLVEARFPRPCLMSGAALSFWSVFSSTDRSPSSGHVGGWRTLWVLCEPLRIWVAHPCVFCKGGPSHFCTSGGFCRLFTHKRWPLALVCEDARWPATLLRAWPSALSHLQLLPSSAVAGESGAAGLVHLMLFDLCGSAAQTLGRVHLRIETWKPREDVVRILLNPGPRPQDI